MDVSYRAAIAIVLLLLFLFISAVMNQTSPWGVVTTGGVTQLGPPQTWGEWVRYLITPVLGLLLMDKTSGLGNKPWSSRGGCRE